MGTRSVRTTPSGVGAGAGVSVGVGVGVGVSVGVGVAVGVEVRVGVGEAVGEGVEVGTVVGVSVGVDVSVGWLVVVAVRVATATLADSWVAGWTHALRNIATRISISNKNRRRMTVTPMRNTITPRLQLDHHCPKDCPRRPGYFEQPQSNRS